MTIPLLADPALQAQAQKDAKILETTLKNTKAGTGTHDKGAIGALLARHPRGPGVLRGRSSAPTPSSAARPRSTIRRHDYASDRHLSHESSGVASPIDSLIRSVERFLALRA